jgi:hypothetical protein
VTARWSYTQPAGSQAVFSHFAVTITNRAGKTLWAANSTTATSKTLRSQPGRTFVVKVTGYDTAGDSNSATASVTVPIDDTHFTYSPAWNDAANSAAYGGSFHESSRTGAIASYTASARTYTVWFVTSTDGGRADIFVGSTLVKVVDLYSPATHFRVPVLVYSSPKRGSFTIKVTVSGTKDSSSSGRNVWVDALQASP